MIKKIFLFLVILTVLYSGAIFLFPEVSAKIDNLLGIPGFSENIREKKFFFDGAVTSTPNIDEIKQGYSEALSGARDIRDTVTNGIDTTKDTIDTIRTGAQQAQDTYNESKETIENAKQVFNEATGKFEEIKEIIDNVQQLTGTGAQ